MSLPKAVKMKSVDGQVEVPTIGFGTWALGGHNWCGDATLHAIKAGYRHIDCAWHYGVDKEVGVAIRESKVPRNELFITSKFWPQFGAPENVKKCLDVCLQNMGIDYLDLFLAHWPVVLKAASNLSTAKSGPGATDADKGIATDTNGKPIVDWAHTCQSIAAANDRVGTFVPTWRAMQRLVTTGKVRAVGVSNFNIAQLQEILSAGGEVPVSCNQIEAHPRFPNTQLLDFMQEADIMKAVYSPLGGQKEGGIALRENPFVVRLAKKNQMGVGQLLHSWAVQRGTIPIGKSQTLARITANLDVRKLPEEDMHALDSMDQGAHGRTVDLGPAWGVEFY